MTILSPLIFSPVVAKRLIIKTRTISVSIYLTFPDLENICLFVSNNTELKMRVKYHGLSFRLQATSVTYKTYDHPPERN